MGVNPEWIVCNHAYNKETYYCENFNNEVKSTFSS